MRDQAYRTGEALTLRSIGGRSNNPAGGGCPICRTLREYQSDSLKNLDATTVGNLCSFHVWSVAASADLPTAAAIFLQLLDKSSPEEANNEPCALCVKLLVVEREKLQEYSRNFNKPGFQKWFREEGTLCMRHIERLIACMPDALREDVFFAMRQRKTDLKQRLGALLRKAKAGEPAQAGLLGRVAEFLAAQRGLGRDS